MPSLSVHLRAGQRTAIFDRSGTAEHINIVIQPGEAGNPVVTDHVLLPNTVGGDEIYDEVAAYFRGDPVLANGPTAPTLHLAS